MENWQNNLRKRSTSEKIMEYQPHMNLSFPNRVSFWNRTKASLVLALALSFSSIASQAIVLELVSEAQVDLQGISLGQLVKPSKDVSPDLQVAQSPAWGETRKFTRAQLSEALAKVLPSTQIDWAGAPEIRVTRRSRLFQDRELLALLSQELQSAKDPNKTAELELALTREWKPIPVPVEPIEIKILDRPQSGFAPNMLVKFQITSGPDSIGIFSVFLRAQLFREVWVARSNLRRGAALSSDNFSRERRDVINERNPLWNGQELDPNLQIIQTISTGSILLARAVESRPVIRQGDLIQAVMADNVISVSMRVQAMESGAPDQIIRIRNPKTRKELRGKVINEDTVEVIF